MESPLDEDNRDALSAKAAVDNNPSGVEVLEVHPPEEKRVCLCWVGGIERKETCL
jgi:hypothetical protein